MNSTALSSLASDRRSSQRKRDALLAAVLALFAFALIVLTANDIGLTYDEPVYAGEALRARSWLEAVVARVARGELSALTDRSLLEQGWRGKDMQPALLKWVIALIGPSGDALIGGLAGFRTAAAFFCALMIAGTYAFARTCLSRASSVFAALTLLFLPHVFALSHLMSLDIAVAAMTVVTTCLYYHAVTRSDGRWFALAGASLGLALNAKMNAVLIVPAVGTWILLRRVAVARTLVHGMGSAVVAFVVFMVAWPFLWTDTVARLGEYARFHFQHYPINVSYFGQVTAHPPWHFPLVMTVITTPLMALALMTAGALCCARQPEIRRGAGGLWLCSIAWQYAAFVNPSTPKYNAVRLFVAAFPFLCLLAGVAHERLAERGRATGLPRLRWALVLLLLAPGLRATVASHPFGLSFYNTLVGGAGGAARRGFEPTYWGDAFYALLPWLNEKATENARIAVVPSSVIWLMEHYQNLGAARKDLHFIARVEECDLLIFHGRQSEMTALAQRLRARGEFVYAERHDGAVLAAVVAGRAARAEAGSDD